MLILLFARENIIMPAKPIKVVIFSYAHFVEAIITGRPETKICDMQGLQYVFDTLTKMNITLVIAPKERKFSIAESAQFFQLCNTRHTSHTIMPWLRNMAEQKLLGKYTTIDGLSVDLAMCEIYAKKHSANPGEVLLVSRNRTTSPQVMAKGFSTLYLRQLRLIECLFKILYRVDGVQPALKLKNIELTFKLMLQRYIADNCKMRFYDKTFITLLETLIQQTCRPAQRFSPRPQAKDSALAALLEQSKVTIGQDIESLLQNAAHICSLENKRWTKTRNIHLETLTDLLNKQTQYAKYRAFIKNGTVSTEDVRKYGQETVEEQLNSTHTLTITEPKDNNGFVELT